MTTITFQDIDPAQKNHLLAYLEKEKLNFEVSEREKKEKNWHYKPLHLWTEEEKLERDKFLKEHAFFKPGMYKELVPDPFNLGY